MELLHPHHPPLLHCLSSPSRFLSLETAEAGGVRSEKLYVAVGKKVEKALSLLQWSFKQFVGKLPASQANNELVNAHRGEEKENTRKLLDIYLTTCARAKVKASVLVTEAELVPRGIVELVNRHCIKKLVMGAVPASCLKMRSSRKVDYASRKAPPFCEIWFVIQGKHAWVREAFEARQVSSARSFRLSKSSLSLALTNLRSKSSRNLVSSELSSGVEADQFDTGVSMFSSRQCDLSGTKSSVCGSVFVSEETTDAEIPTHEELNCKNKVIEAVNKVRVFESAHAYQVKLRENAESELRNIINQQKKLLEEKKEFSRELQRTRRNVALLNCKAQERTRRCKEVSTEVKLVELSISKLRLEKQKIQRQKLEAKHWIERWKSTGSLNCNEFVGISGEGMLELAEFSLSELESATFCFSESFKLGQGGNNGSVYKGEMMGRTVAIKQLHQPHNIRLQQEFQQEVRVLSKLQHPHLVTLFGYCPEALSLVYEYLPNGNLQDQLFRKTDISPLSWKTRTRIIAEISSALCFLHSIKPERILHSDLKPENILLDSKLTCKLCDYGICRLMFDEEANGALPYMDPEFNRFGILTPKSDVYSFGIIILQLLTGKPPVGLVGQVRKALSLGKLASVLDIKAGEWPIFVAGQLANIGLRCCETNSRDRPDLTPSLVKELEQLHVPEERAVPSFYLCSILQEIMHDPQIAEDGFTYEGEAIRSWFRNGHETSPMTNLKLNRLHLMPNHGLRLAIQDWLCKS